jgi:hypothetical protein
MHIKLQFSSLIIRIFTVIYLASYVQFAWGQTQVFGNYDFDKTGYYILGVRSESDPNNLSDTLGDFYTNDINILNKFKETWVFNTPSPMHACGYHYIVHICKDGKSLEAFPINLNCNEIVTDRGSYFFDSQKIEIFKGDLKKPYIKRKYFKNLDEGRRYFNKILKDKDLIMTTIPVWLKYEGSFTFNYTIADSGRPYSYEQEEKVLKILKEQIAGTYPGEDFELKVVGWSAKELNVEVNSNKSLYIKFKLYPLGWRDWKNYKSHLITYWTEKGIFDRIIHSITN